VIDIKLSDLKRGQLIELRWEYFDHDLDEFEPRFLKVILMDRLQYHPVRNSDSEPRGWKAMVIYDSNTRKMAKGNFVPYINMYFDTWLSMSIEQNKLKVIL